MAQAKQSSKRKRRQIALPAVGAAGGSLALTGGASAAAAPIMDQRSHPYLPGHEITLGEEEMSDVSLATFYVRPGEPQIDRANCSLLQPAADAAAEQADAAARQVCCRECAALAVPWRDAAWAAAEGAASAWASWPAAAAAAARGVIAASASRRERAAGYGTAIAASHHHRLGGWRFLPAPPSLGTAEHDPRAGALLTRNACVREPPLRARS